MQRCKAGSAPWLAETIGKGPKSRMLLALFYSSRTALLLASEPHHGQPGSVLEIEGVLQGPGGRQDGLALALSHQTWASNGHHRAPSPGAGCCGHPKIPNPGNTTSSCQLETSLSLTLRTLAWRRMIIVNGLIETLNVIAPTWLSSLVLFSFLMKHSVYFSLYQGCWRGF